MTEKHARYARQETHFYHAPFSVFGARAQTDKQLLVHYNTTRDMVALTLRPSRLDLSLNSRGSGCRRLAVALVGLRRVFATAASAAASISTLALLNDLSPSRRPHVADPPDADDLSPLSSVDCMITRSGDSGAEAIRCRTLSGCCFGIVDVEGGVSAKRSSDGDSAVGNCSRSVSDPDRDKRDRDSERSLRRLLDDAREVAECAVDGAGDRDKRLTFVVGEGVDSLDPEEMDASLSRTYVATPNVSTSSV